MFDELQRRLEGKRSVLLAVGNAMRGDDALGPTLADRLQGKVSATIVDAGEVPEN
jgi:Ni,Fe-hydrogenase maturation factor